MLVDRFISPLSITALLLNLCLIAIAVTVVTAPAVVVEAVEAHISVISE